MNSISTYLIFINTTLALLAVLILLLDLTPGIYNTHIDLEKNGHATIYNTYAPACTFGH